MVYFLWLLHVIFESILFLMINLCKMIVHVIYDEYVRSWYIFLFCNALILGFPCCFRSYSKTANGLRSKVKKMLDKKALLGTPSTTGSFENILLYNRIPYLNSLGYEVNALNIFMIYLKWKPSSWYT